MKRFEKAVDDFNQGFNCSQSVLAAFAEEFGLNQEMARSVAAGFGGGMGRMGETCGAVSGAFMVIGLKYGPLQRPDKGSKEIIYSLINQFAEKFITQHQSLKCRELLGYDISNPTEREKARANQVFTTICPKLVEDAVKILEELL